jgi:predicted RNase H-like HicB family nuclease/DNA-binding XRE family transcriptional regulator
MKYHFEVSEEGSGFWAKCLELEGCATQGDSREDLLANMKVALNLYLDEPTDGLVFPLPKDMTESDRLVAVEVDPELAFALSLKRARTERNLTQREVASRLGMKNIYSYQRLERRSNPTLTLLKRVREVFPDISIDALA